MTTLGLVCTAPHYDRWVPDNLETLHLPHALSGLIFTFQLKRFEREEGEPCDKEIRVKNENHIPPPLVCH